MKIINFNQEFYQVTEADLLFTLYRFQVYKTIPIDASADPEITYLTIIAETFRDIGESAIMAVRIRLGRDNQSYLVNTQLLIITGEQESFAPVEAAILKTFIPLKINDGKSAYRIRIEKIDK